LQRRNQLLFLKEMFGNSPVWGTIMVILLPYFESDRLKNGSVITLIAVEI